MPTQETEHAITKKISQLFDSFFRFNVVINIFMHPVGRRESAVKAKSYTKKKEFRYFGSDIPEIASNELLQNKSLTFYINTFSVVRIIQVSFTYFTYRVNNEIKIITNFLFER